MSGFQLYRFGIGPSSSCWLVEFGFATAYCAFKNMIGCLATSRLGYYVSSLLARLCRSMSKYIALCQCEITHAYVHQINSYKGNRL